MAAISYVFTISYVAEMLGEDEEWLREISINMDPEEGCVWVIGVGEDGCPAFTDTGSNASSRSSSRNAPPRAQARPGRLTRCLTLVRILQSQG
jgi:hypothetical protein